MLAQHSDIIGSEDDSLDRWPADSLEAVKTCPVCGNSDRAVAYADLRDNVFFTAPGRWCLWRCTECETHYLDPRPSPESIHLAYANYYTHEEPLKRPAYTELGRLKKIKRHLVNGYTNRRYHTDEQPAAVVLGTIAAYLFPGLTKNLDLRYRYLRNVYPQRGTVLDLGCGNGAFLAIARSAGWSAVGLDTDRQAVAACIAMGFEAHYGSIEHFAGQVERFDVITMSHVVEHVHDPIDTLRACHRLLKPSGQLWLETPNIHSFGHAHFRRNWRGLEPPRHLVLFNSRSLRSALRKAGFFTVDDLRRPSPCWQTFLMSRRMEQGLDPSSGTGISIRTWMEAALAGVAERVAKSRREFLTIIATK